MRMPRWICTSCVFISVAATAPAIDRLPVENFARSPEVSRARLSPDGKQLAYMADHNRINTLHVLDLESRKTKRLNLGEAALQEGLLREVDSFVWVGDRRLLLVTTANDAYYGTIAINDDGQRNIPLTGFENVKQLRIDGNYRVPASLAREVIHVFGDKDSSVLMLERNQTGGGGTNRPEVIRMNTTSGIARTVVKNPGEVASWSPDFDGVVRLGILSHGDLSGMIYRSTEAAAWQTVLPLKDRRGHLRPMGFDAATGRVIVSALTPEKRWAPYAMDPATGELGEPMLADAVYDIIPDRSAPSLDGIALAGPVFSKAKRSLIGIRYYTDAARVKWFDPEFVRYQAAVDRSLPETVNLLAGLSDDGRRMLWFSYSDRDPGSYHLLDLEAKSFKPLGARMPWIKPVEMAPTHAIKYAARDGLVIHGYLTVPAGHEPKQLPLVVKPHGGPWVRDVWGFDPLVQLLANRGYAVLQMNYRGSTGYGDELLKNAKREIGGKIQEDIEDGTRWAIAAGVADPKRIAIYGMSYGGYSALHALGRSPELYRCGISFAGPTDWHAMYRQSDVADYKQATRHWREQIGDPSKDEAMLKAISPVYFADKITAPVLIIQGKKDQRVPQVQARIMVEALEKAGRKPQTLFLSGVGHNYGQPKDREEIYNATVEFLEKHLGPGVP
jgi:dipeptidyl aminopeptidase/acylaminoacyl peptidase